MSLEVADIVRFINSNGDKEPYYYGFIARTVKTDATIQNIGNAKITMMYEVEWFDGCRSSCYTKHDIVKVEPFEHA
jgi:hypothetical protein